MKARVKISILHPRCFVAVTWRKGPKIIINTHSVDIESSTISCSVYLTSVNAFKRRHPDHLWSLPVGLGSLHYIHTTVFILLYGLMS